MQGLDCSGKHFLDYVQLLNIQKLMFQKFQNSSVLETAAMLEVVTPLQVNVYAMMADMAWIVLVMAATHLVPNPFDPRASGPPLPVPLDKRSPLN